MKRILLFIIIILFSFCKKDEDKKKDPQKGMGEVCFYDESTCNGTILNWVIRIHKISDTTKWVGGVMTTTDTWECTGGYEQYTIEEGIYKWWGGNGSCKSSIGGYVTVKANETTKIIITGNY